MEMNQQDDNNPDFKSTQGQLERNSFKNQNQRYNSFFKIMLLVINFSLSSLYFGYTIIYMNVVEFDTIMDVFDVTMQKSKAQGLLTFCVPLGGLFGAFLSSEFIAKISRRKSILYINYFAFFIGLLVFIPNLKLYMLLRFLQGACAGLFSAIVPLLIKQTVPSELFGIFGVFHQLFISLGVFSACFLSFVLSKIFQDETGALYWKYIFGFPLILLAVQTIIYIFIFPFQTPKYLIDNGQIEEARGVLEYIYKDYFIQQVSENYQKDKRSREQEQKVSSDDSQPSKDSLIITKYISVHLSLLQQMAGISAVSTYAGEIASGNLQQYKAILPSIINFQQVVTAIISSFLLTKYGRKQILQLGTIGASLTNFLIGFGFMISKQSPSFSVFLILLGLFLYMMNFGFSLGPIVWMYIPQIVDASFLPFSTMVNWGGSALCILLFPIIKAQLPDENPFLLFYFFSAVCCASYFVNKKYVLQTKDKTPTLIRKQFQQLQEKQMKD